MVVVSLGLSTWLAGLGVDAGSSPSLGASLLFVGVPHPPCCCSRRCPPPLTIVPPSPSSPPCRCSPHHCRCPPLLLLVSSLCPSHPRSPGLNSPRLGNCSRTVKEGGEMSQITTNTTSFGRCALHVEPVSRFYVSSRDRLPGMTAIERL